MKLEHKIVDFLGTWKFMIIGISSIALWMFLNPVDPSPYILLNLLLNICAFLQAPIILKSQSQKEQQDKYRDDEEFKQVLEMKNDIKLIKIHMEKNNGCINYN